MAGYSGTPLPKKLGIREDAEVALVGAPKGFERVLGRLPAGVNLRRDLRGRGKKDVIVFFTLRRAELARRVEALGQRLEPAGGLWIAWPKKASGVPTDVGEADVRALGLATGLVDNKICAIDETWSGMRFVIRRENR